MKRYPTHRVARLALLVATCLWGCSSSLLACPMCSQALADSSQGGDLISGFFWSIVFMMSMPFVIVASLGTYFYLQIRRARAAQAALAAAQAQASATVAPAESDHEMVEA